MDSENNRFSIKNVLLFLLLISILSAGVLAFSSDLRRLFYEGMQKEKTEQFEISAIGKDVSDIGKEIIYRLEVIKDNILGKWDDVKEIPSVNITSGAFSPCVGTTVTSDFGNRISPVTEKAEFHKGVDIALSEGSDIFSAWPGTVKEAGYNEIDGNYIVVLHSENFSTKYAHLSEISKRNGEYVSAGEKIGEAGKTGWATGSHLHFEILVEEKNIDPKEWLSFC